jgi:YHS domain-containing protein
MQIIYRRFTGPLFVAMLLLSSVQTACAKSPVNTNWRGLAVKGYDVVAYFTLGKPTKGTNDFSYEWQGATWRFANAEHLETFKADPQRYAPQYGGY